MEWIGITGCFAPESAPNKRSARQIALGERTDNALLVNGHLQDNSSQHRKGEETKRSMERLWSVPSLEIHVRKTLIAATMLSLLGPVVMAQPAAPRSASQTTSTPPAPSNSRSGDVNAASGNSNQAVATTSANAPTPARGANSFTEGEARSRIEAKGFSNVGGLAKDGDGVWRGTAQKGSQQAQVWLDYKGNVGQQ